MDLIFMCLGILPESMVVMKLQESIITPGTGITDSCKLPCGGWELYLGPWAEQSVLLTALIHLSSAQITAL